VNIAITVDPEIPIPPVYYGGIERVVDMLLRGLIEKGHDVTLFANPTSSVLCQLHGLPGRNSRSLKDTFTNSLKITREVLGGRYNIVHSFGRLAYLWPLLVLGQAVVMTYQRPITPKSVNLGCFISKGKIRFTSVGHHLTKGLKGNWAVIPNGVDTKYYEPSREVDTDAPLTFLGRIEEIKGVHLAIDVAKKCSKRLIIMGNVEAEHEDYFNERIKPHLDGQRIKYLGKVDDATKNEVLAQSSALLMPVLWEEPFGIVMIEALACGTPVIGLNIGSIPEVINHEITGFVCKDCREMIEAVGRLSSISRGTCRTVAEEQFDSAVIVNAYENLYFSAIRDGAGI
jgi:glycosyltransferase involved in cell wall biosynthesis